MSNLPLPSVSGLTDKGSEEIRRYLFRLVEAINMSFADVSRYVSTVENPDFEGKGITENTAKAIDDSASELKSLIIKNAKDIYAEMDEMSETFRSTYVAKSEYGTFVEDITNEIVQRADGQQQNYETLSEIVGQYISTTNGYIRQGVVRYDGITPIIGIAIGQDITVTGVKVTVNGIEYETIDTSHNMSVLTSEKLSFYINGSEAAYFANNSLYVNRFNIGNWEIDTSIGFAIKWSGGVVN